MKSEKKKQILCAIVCTGLLIVLDLFTKSQARQALAGGPVELIPGVFELRYLENHGAAFGIMQNKRIFFILITLVFLALAVFYFLKLPTDRRYRPMRIITTFVAAGAVGNFIDGCCRKFHRPDDAFLCQGFPVFQADRFPDL